MTNNSKQKSNTKSQKAITEPLRLSPQVKEVFTDIKMERGHTSLDSAVRQVLDRVDFLEVENELLREELAKCLKVRAEYEDAPTEKMLSRLEYLEVETRLLKEKLAKKEEERQEKKEQCESNNV